MSPRRVIHEVNLLNVSVDEQMSYVLDFLRVNGFHDVAGSRAAHDGETLDRS